jgi:putative membrane protein insertion efficiency factor
MLKRGLVAVLRFYKAGISPLLPPSCRYEPTCSEYARIAIERYGAGRGSWLALRRLARCHPFGGSGLDPVPEATASSDQESDN